MKTLNKLLPIFGIAVISSTALPLASCSLKVASEDVDDEPYEEEHQMDSGGTIELQQNIKGQPLIYKIVYAEGYKLDEIVVYIGDGLATEGVDWMYDEDEQALIVFTENITEKIVVNVSTDTNTYEEEHTIDSGGSIQLQTNQWGKGLVYKISFEQDCQLESISVTIGGNTATRGEDWIYDENSNILIVLPNSITGKVVVNVETDVRSYYEEHNIDAGGTIEVQRNIYGDDLVYKITCDDECEIKEIGVFADGVSLVQDYDWSYNASTGILTIDSGSIWSADKIEVTVTTDTVEYVEEHHIDAGGTITVEQNIKTKDLIYKINYEHDSGLDKITVTIGDQAATKGSDWTYNESTGILTIKASSITGSVVVNVTTQDINILTPLTLKNEDSTDGYLWFEFYNMPELVRNIKYSTNGTTWQTLNWKDDNEDNYVDTPILVPENGFVQLKGNNSSTGWNIKSSSIDFNFLDANKKDLLCSLSGNIMSLVYEDFIDKKAIPTDYCFRLAFGYSYSGLLKLASARNLVLPATTLTEGCYELMFWNSNLTYGPKTLPSETAKSNCYHSMFNTCQSLVESPEIYATNVAESSFNSMFLEDSELKKVKIHYSGKFCEEYLIPTTDPFFDWLYDVSDIGTIYYKPDQIGYTPTLRGSSTIPENWIIKSNW